MIKYDLEAAQLRSRDKNKKGKIFVLILLMFFGGFFPMKLSAEQVVAPMRVVDLDDPNLNLNGRLIKQIWVYKGDEKIVKFDYTKPVKVPSLKPKDIFQKTDPLPEFWLPMKYQRKLDFQKKINGLINFSISQIAIYDDNVLLASKGSEQADYIYSAFYGLNFNLIDKNFSKILGRFRLGVSYLVAYDYYMKNRNLNNFNNFVGVNLDSDSDPFFKDGRLRLSMSESLAPDRFVNPAASTESSDQSFRWVNDFNLTATYMVTGKTDFELPYNNTYIRYQDKAAQNFNSMRQQISPTIRYAWRPKTQFNIGADLAKTTFQQSINNSNDYVFRGGINQGFGLKKYFNFSGGVQFHNTPEQGSKSHGFNFAGTYHHSFSQQTVMDLVATRSITTTLTSLDQQDVTQTVSQAVESGNPTYTTTNFNLSATHFWSPKWYSDFDAGVIYNNQDSPQTKQTLYQASAGLGFVIRKGLTINLTYLFTKSNITNQTTTSTTSTSNTSSNPSETGDAFGSNYDRSRILLSINYNHGDGQSLFGGQIQSREQETFI